ncbi:MAG: DNA ligase D [Comamonadaceae bacterium]|nr:DNA ligase D [Comamonadaceae bacterium]
MATRSPPPSPTRQRTPRKRSPLAHELLKPYTAKRNFAITPEPAGDVQEEVATGQFVVQKHWATRLHYDFRLELDGVMKSWAVPKGPSLDPSVKRMAVQVEDHPVSYAGFEGTIPKGQYGAGRVIVWDKGQWAALGDAREGLSKGSLKFELSGHKLRGRWALVRMKGKDPDKPAWLLLKERDALAMPENEISIVEARPDSVAALDMPAKAPASPPTTAHAKPEARASKKSGWPAQAVPSELPPSLSPQLATRFDQPVPDGGDWSYEIKFDGYRLLARIQGSQVKLFTRSGLDWTARLKPLHRALQAMRLPDGWYDGEIVVMGAHGLPDFGALQRCFENGRTSDVVFQVFDLPYVEDQDLRAVPLVQRREMLAGLLSARDVDMVRFSVAFDGTSADVLLSACRLGLEGVIAKQKQSVYRSGRSSDWLKLKCGRRQEFVIGGYTEGKGSRAGMGALMLGVYDDEGGLRHVGNVGTGFNEARIKALLSRMKPLEQPASPFSVRPTVSTRAHWLKPSLVAEVAFADWTAQGHIRHAVFVALREDKPARSVERELPLPADAPAPVPPHPVQPVPANAPTTSTRSTPSGPVRVTHAQRVIDASTGATKLDLYRHYEAVADLMMPHLKQRPVALLRAPKGIGEETFFQKHLSAKLAGITQLDRSLSPGKPPLIAVSQPVGLLSAAQWNVIELHTQNAVASRFEKPNRLVFDLDPGQGVGWEQVQEAALLMRSMLDQLGLRCFLKTSGGKGLHVVAPIRQQHAWDEAKGFAQAVVEHMSLTIPQRFVAKSGPRNRVGRIFIDYLRNGLGATTVSAWSARARPGMGVSVPVNWDELDGLSGGDHWNCRSIRDRLTTGNGPWRDYARAARSLTGPMKLLGYKP